jgi:hypothetical protein
MAGIWNGSRPATRWRAAWVVAALAGGVLLALGAGGPVRSGPDEEKAPGGAALPPDLQRVPADAAVFVSVRVADLWNQEAAAGAREGLTRDVPDALREWQSLLGVPPGEVERLTLVFPEFGAREEPAPVAFVATVKPYDKAKVLAAVAPGAPEERRNGHTLYAAPKGNGIHFMGDRAFQVGRPEAVRSLLERPAADKEGPLSPALELAAKDHSLVIGVNPRPIVKGFGDNFPPQARAFLPLLKAELATAALDFGRDVRGRLRLTFAGEDQAKDAEEALKAALDLLRTSLSEGLQQLAKGPAAKTKVFEVGRRLADGLKDAEPERKGARVELAVRVNADLATTAPAFAEAVQKVREAAARVQSSNNLKQMCLAMINYADSHQGRLPPQALFSKDGKPLLSWRVLILPYIEQEALYKEFHLDEPWDSEHNKKLLARMPRTFALPGKEKEAAAGQTYYLGFVGKGAFFEEKKALRYPADFPDGTSNTIMFVEAAEAVPWTKPEDLPFDPGKPLPKLGGRSPGGFLAALCDGSVRLVSSSISEKTLRAAITRNGGEVLGDDW